MNKIMLAAEMANEVVRVYARTLCDYTYVDWKYLEQPQKDLRIRGVIDIVENPNQTAEEAHNKWLFEKKKDGWVYAPKRNHEMKKHPYIVEYSELPKEQRIKDELFIETVKMVLRINFD